MNAASSKQSGCMSCSGVILAGLVLVLVGYFGLRALGAYLVTGQDAVASDAIVLLGGGDVLRREEAVRLFGEKMGSYIVLSDTGEEIIEFNVDYIRIVQEQLVQAGVPDTAILQTAKASDSTLDEARVVRSLLEEKQLHSAIIVTDPYHTRRTQLIYTDAFQDSGIRIIVRPVRSHWYRSDRWFLNPEGWRMTLLELVKLAAYRLGIQAG